MQSLRKSRQYELLNTVRKGSISPDRQPIAFAGASWRLTAQELPPAPERSRVQAQQGATGHELPVPAQRLQLGYQSSNGQAQPRSNAAWPLLIF